MKDLESEMIELIDSEETNYSKIIKGIILQPNSTSKQLVESTGVSRSSVSSTLKAMMNMTDLLTLNRINGKDGYEYSVTKLNMSITEYQSKRLKVKIKKASRPRNPIAGRDTRAPLISESFSNRFFSECSNIISGYGIGGISYE